MIKPKVPCKIIYSTGNVDDYGVRTFSNSVDALCSVVKLETTTNKTSVRTDSSGSGGAAKEIEAAARLLFFPSTNLKENDRVEVGGVALKVVGVQIRYQVFKSIPDHLQVDLEIWV